MKILLIQSNCSLSERALGSYDPVLDDYRSILMELCSGLAEQKAASFSVSGFGDEDWAVSVDVDLAVILEQMPDAISKAERGEEFSLDFYEQGVQRFLDFKKDLNRYKIKCTSLTDWKPNPEEEEITTEHLLEMLRSTLDMFLALAEQLSPDFDKHPWIQAWRSGQVD